MNPVRLVCDWRFEVATDLGPDGWVVGTTSDTTFTAGGPSDWKLITYPTGCVAAPAPEPSPAPANTKGLYFGGTCSYANLAGSGAQAVRIKALGVTRDDALSFKFWRQVRSGQGSLDALSVSVVLDSVFGATEIERRVWRVDGGESSLGRG